MLTMMLAAAFAAALASDPTGVTSDPPAVPSVAPAPPPGAAPGAHIFSYADLKAMDAKGSGRAPPPAPHAGPAHVKTSRRPGRHGPVRHAVAVPLAAPHLASPNLRPAFALEKTAKITR